MTTIDPKLVAQFADAVRERRALIAAMSERHQLTPAQHIDVAQVLNAEWLRLVLTATHAEERAARMTLDDVAQNWVNACAHIALAFQTEWRGGSDGTHTGGNSNA